MEENIINLFVLSILLTSHIDTGILVSGRPVVRHMQAGPRPLIKPDGHQRMASGAPRAGRERQATALPQSRFSAHNFSLLTSHLLETTYNKREWNSKDFLISGDFTSKMK